MALGDDYIAAVKSGNTAQANYLAQMLAAQAGININANTVEAAPLSMLQPGLGALPSLPSIPGQGSNNDGGFWSGLGNFPFLQAFPSLTPNSIAGDAKSVGNALSSVGSAVDFITDIPRVVTTLLGLILIIAGIFALSRGPAVNIVGSAIKEAATS